MEIFWFYLAIIDKPIISGNSPQCSPSLMSLKHACTKSAEAGNWEDSMQFHLTKNDKHDDNINGLQVACVRNFSDVEQQKSLLEATRTCGSTQLEYGGISRKRFALYDHIYPAKEKNDSKFLNNHNFVKLHYLYN